MQHLPPESKVTLLFISIQLDLLDYCSSGDSALWLVLIQTKSQLGHTHGNNQRRSGRNIEPQVTECPPPHPLSLSPWHTLAITHKLVQGRTHTHTHKLTN